LDGSLLIHSPPVSQASSLSINVMRKVWQGCIIEVSPKFEDSLKLHRSIVD
jgi:hypothetical protein